MYYDTVPSEFLKKIINLNDRQKCSEKKNFLRSNRLPRKRVGTSTERTTEPRQL